MGVSNPTNFVHKIHVGFDAVSGNFTVRHAFASSIPLFALLTHAWWFGLLGDARAMGQTLDPVCDYEGGLYSRSTSSP